MDNASAKNLLSAYRPEGADSTDPLFRSALDQCDADPELRDWLDSEREFDRRMIQAFSEIHPPESGKEAVLSTAPLELRARARFRSWSKWAIPLAACLLIALGLLYHFRPHAEVDWRPGRELVAQLSEDRRQLDFQGDNIFEVREWLRAQGAPAPDTLPEVLLAAKGQGCKLFEDDAGNVVSMLCFMLEGELVHVFIFDEQTRHYASLRSDVWEREGDWNLRALEQEGLLLAISTRGDTRQLSKMW